MNIKALLLTLLIVSSTYFVWYREGTYQTTSEPPWLEKSHNTNDPFVQEIAVTVKNLSKIGPYISNIAIEHGIRKMHGEVAGSGEVKISLNLAWQSLSSSLTLHDILDWTAAMVITDVFSQHQDISKIRVVLKIPKKNKNVPDENLGKALGHKNAAKVFSITRAAWQLAMQQSDGRYDPMLPLGAKNILALGDYVVLTDKGWVRGD